MSHSQRLRSTDILSIMRLVREACELGEDAIAWREHAMNGLISMFRASMATLWVAGWDFDPSAARLKVIVAHGLASQWQEYLARGDLSADPTTAWIEPRMHGGFTDSRTRMCSDRDWYKSPHFNERFRPLKWDHMLLSIAAIPEFGLLSGIGFLGSLGDSPFCERQRRMCQLFQDELATLWRSAPLTAAGQPAWREQLTPRLVQVLDALLLGLSEKEVASHLDIKPATAHNHVVRLYHELDVSSRAELHVLAKSRARPAFRPRLLPVEPAHSPLS